ncbi:3-coathanger stack domain-containing protein [Flavobacterium sp. XGLA_31]|uniref:3-coathanger stack domain-containing protein n=1 Tax=Flavobacterium sp. XGLA_31 TaxID=3447666 RepID=UPI003F3872F1
MNKVFKIAFFCLLCLSSTKISAQYNEYIKSEEDRITATQQTEIEIQNFIRDNFNKYKLSQEVNEKILNHLRSEDEFTDAELEIAKSEAKKYELRKLFFVENPIKKQEYIARQLPQALSQQCVNGDFESGIAGYTFWSDAHPQPASGTDFFLSCATPTALTATNVIAPATNNFNATITRIDSSSPGYQQFDPVLASFGVNMPTLPSNGGTKCIKLNNTAGLGSSDLSTVSRYFPSINQPTIDFNFSLIMDNKPAHGQDIQPYFRVRVLNQNGNVVDEICIIADPDNCLFNRINVAADRRILYTGWVCARLNVEDIMNQPGTIEFSVSDCQPSKHFGTVYIDNICGTTCASPQLGAVSMAPTNLTCPDVSNNAPFQVCGTYTAPVNASLNNITLDITQNGVVIGTIAAPTQITATTFCFTVYPSIFGVTPTGNFEFDLHATFNVNCPAGNFVYDIYDHSANAGPDVTFDNCCEATLTLTAPFDNTNNLAPVINRKKERSNWIKAANIISVGDNTQANGVVYHATNYVELNPGFEAIQGAQFIAYPEGCTSNFVYKNQTAADADSDGKTKHDLVEDTDVNLERIVNTFAIIPNPSSSAVEISMKQAMFNKISISTIDGKVVYERTLEPTDRAKVDVSGYANGIYIINVTSEDGLLLTEKLIKN